jgi:hypothetical protein
MLLFNLFGFIFFGFKHDEKLFDIDSVRNQVITKKGAGGTGEQYPFAKAMGYKKSSPDKSDELLNMLNLFRSYVSGLSSPLTRDGVGTFSTIFLS